MRLPMYSGVQAISAFASKSGCRRSSAARNQSSVMRKMSGVSQRQQCG